MTKNMRLLGAGIAAAGALALPTSAFAASNPAAGATSTPAVTLRANLSELLGAHAVLAQLAMEAGYSGAADYTQLTSALNQNTQELSQAVASVYGSAAGSAFKKLWAGHIADFVNYVVATKNHDAAGQQAALKALTQYRAQFSAFMAKANPNISAQALSASLQVHVNQLINTFKAYVAGNNSLAAQDFVAAYDHMFMSGDYLATAIAKQYPTKFMDSNPNTPAANLRLTLDQLLGAHAVLAQLAMETGFSGSPQYAAWGAALSQNTNELSQAIASVYGTAAGADFKKLWAGHIADFVNYVVATKKNDPAGQKAALSDLAQYKVQFATFLAGANPHYNPAALEQSLQVHVNQLIATFNAFVHQNDAAAIPDFVTAYNHMFMSGSYLSSGIVQQFPSKFGITMVPNATSPVTGIPYLPVMAIGSAIAVAGTALLARTGRAAR